MLPIKTITLLVQLVLLAMLAYFGASTVNGLVAASMRPERSLVLPEPPPAKAPERKKPLRHFASITKTSIFNPPREVEVVPVESGPKPAPPLKAKLLGTMPGSGGMTSYAVVFEETMKKQMLYRVGDRIQDRTLAAVARDHIVLEREGRKQKLFLEDPDDAKGSSAKGSTRSGRGSGGGGEGIEKLSDTSYVIDEDLVEKSLQNMNQLFTQVRAVPHFENGKAQGFRLFAIRKGSVFEQLGLKNGDIVTSVNGDALTDPVKAMGLLKELQGSGQVDLDMKRNRQPVTMNYEIR